MAWERAIQPVKEGGIGATCIMTRYEAIKIGWLKRWWSMEPERLDWAWVANELAYQSAHHKPAVAQTSVQEWICQTWPVKIHSECLPNSLKEMLIAAQKYNVIFSVLKAPTEL